MAFADKKAEYEYINRYHKEKYDRITVMAEKGKKELYREEAEKRGMSLSAFVQSCVDRVIAMEK